MIQLWEVIEKQVEVQKLSFAYFCNRPALNLNLLQGNCRNNCRSKQTQINELLLVLQQPVLDESFPLKLIDFFMVLIMTYSEFEKLMK